MVRKHSPEKVKASMARDQMWREMDKHYKAVETLSVVTPQDPAAVTVDFIKQVASTVLAELTYRRAARDEDAL